MSGASPGGTAVSGLKKRRLAALSQALSSKVEPSPSGPAGKPTSTGPSGPARKKQQLAGGSQPKWRNRSCTQAEAPPPDVFPYNSLPANILQGPVGRSLGLQAAAGGGREGPQGVESLLQMLLSQGKQGAMGRNTGEIVAERIVDKVVVLDNPNTKPAIGSLKKKATKVYSAEVLRGESKKAQFKKAAAEVNFTVMSKVHEVWQQYMTQQLGLNPVGSEELLLQLDWHGAFVQVARCKQPQLEGIQGLVFHISKTTLHLVSFDNRRHYIPLASTVLRLHLGDKFEAVVAGHNLLRVWNKQTPVPLKITKE